LSQEHVVIVGAGVAGLAAALRLATAGLAVTVVERAAEPGGKMRRVRVGDGAVAVDAGPTVFTMRWVFDELFSEAGTTLENEIGLEPLAVLARHAWGQGGRLDLFADIGRTAAAIGSFAGRADARGFLEFSARARRIYAALERPYLRAPRGGPWSLVRRSGLREFPGLLRIAPFARLWSALGAHFRDPRLQQLFGRYATYCGASPFLAPATLMLIAHVEQDGVWTVHGGMHALARALTRTAQERGAQFRFASDVRTVCVERGRTTGVELASGERIVADAVIVNADVAALAGGAFGLDAARAVARMPHRARSLSAVTWALAAHVQGFPLARHNVFFARDYRAEFDSLLRTRTLPAEPTIYVCAQDRNDDAEPQPEGAERLLCLVNAPPTGDVHAYSAAEIDQCTHRTFTLLARHGLHVDRTTTNTVVTTPTEFARLFPGTGGALYGRATHGWRASFARPGARSRIPRLYLAGGSTHPGPGVPMAALSGRQAAQSVLADLTSRSR
jgi:1-hydroxycarotenoid 3,4-desaturase